jgi:thiol-disulfide isomerase/thioredoxin
MKKYFMILIMAAITAAMCVAFAACGGDNAGGDGEEAQYAIEELENGTSLGTFTSTDLDGNKVTEAIFAEKDVTVLNVWGTFCGPCKDEMPDLGKWDKELPDNVQIIGVVIDNPEGDTETTDLAKEICKDTGVTYTNIIASESVDKMFSDVEAIPTTFILDKEGKTVCTPIVGNDVQRYKNAVQEYLDQAD